MRMFGRNRRDPFRDQSRPMTPEQMREGFRRRQEQLAQMQAERNALVAATRANLQADTAFRPPDTVAGRLETLQSLNGLYSDAYIRISEEFTRPIFNQPVELGRENEPAYFVDEAAPVPNPIWTLSREAAGINVIEYGAGIENPPTRTTSPSELAREFLDEMARRISEIYGVSPRDVSQMPMNVISERFPEIYHEVMSTAFVPPEPPIPQSPPAGPDGVYF